MQAFALLCDGQEHRLAVAAGAPVMPEAAFEQATGWHLEERGLCRGDVCIPTPMQDLLADGGVDLAAAAAAMRRPWVTEPGAGVGVLGEAAMTRADALTSLEAPDFALPDLDGNVHRLTDFRGRKVLLAAYASW